MDRSSKGPAMIGVCTVLVLLSAMAVALRFIARRKKHLPYKVDDWLSLTAQILLFAMLVESSLWVAIGGAGEHWESTTSAEKYQFFKIFYSSQITYIILTPTVKISVIFFYRRIFDVKRFRLVSMFLTVTITLYYLGHFIFAAFLQCRPLRKTWNPIVSGYCRATSMQILAFQAVSVLIDIVILLLPLPNCWALKRPWQDRAALSVVFLVGSFACAASIVRLTTLLKLDYADITYSIYDATIWTLIEPCVGVICSCLPVARGLLPPFRTTHPTEFLKPVDTHNRHSYNNGWVHCGLLTSIEPVPVGRPADMEGDDSNIIPKSHEKTTPSVNSDRISLDPV